MHSVLVNATPKRFAKSSNVYPLPAPEGRPSDSDLSGCLGGAANSCVPSTAEGAEPADNAPSSQFRVPGSVTTRPRLHKNSKIEETPSRGAAKITLWTEDVARTPESVHVRCQEQRSKAAEQEAAGTPSKTRERTLQLPIDRVSASTPCRSAIRPPRSPLQQGNINVYSTPMKTSSKLSASASLDSRAMLPDDAEESSIYEGLGWDNVNDDLM